MMDRNDYLARARSIIAEHGRMVQYVGAEPGVPSFAYTIGNTSAGLPELLIFGRFEPQDAMGLLNALSDKMKTAARAFEEGERPDLGHRFRVAVFEANDDAKRHHTILVDDVLGLDIDDYRVQQVVCPDPHGVLPWEFGCHAAYRDVPILRKWRLVS